MEQLKPKIKEVHLREKEELEPLLFANPEYIEEGLTCLRRQFPTDSGYIDLLAVDSDGAITVIELKDEEEDEQLNQGIRYYDWVKTNIAWLADAFPAVDSLQDPRLILIAPRFSDTLKRVAKYTTLNASEVLTLKEYHGIEFSKGERAVLCTEVYIGQEPQPAEIPTIEGKLEYMQSDEIRQLCRECLNELEQMEIEIRPVGGKKMTGWFKGKRFLLLKTRKESFVTYVLDLNGEWGKRLKTTHREDWNKIVNEHIKPALESLAKNR